MRRYLINAAFIAGLTCLGVVMIVFAAYGTHQDQPAKLMETDLNRVVIQFDRSGCYGNCPSYMVTVYGDGRLEYEGKDNVKQKGTAQAHIATADVRALLSNFEKASFLTLSSFARESCTCTVYTDMPTVVTRLEANGISHRVEHYYGCRCAPEALWDLEAAIDKIARTEQWTGDVSKQGPLGTTCFNPKESF